MNIEKLELINRRENQLLLHSCLYYKYGKTIISDDTYDKWSFELSDLINKYPNEFNASYNHECFLDFDPSSGFYLNYTGMESRAVHVYNYHCKVNNINDRIPLT